MALILLPEDSQGGGLILFVLLLAAYFIPTIGAYWNHKKNAGAIFALNLLLGWTVIGWIVAVVWACTTDQPAPVTIVQQVAAAPLSSALCAKCGLYSPAGSKFCNHCGVAIAGGNF